MIISHRSTIRFLILTALLFIFTMQPVNAEQCINLSLPTPTASQSSAQFPPQHAVDRNLNTHWQATQFFSWIAFDLGGNKEICNVEIGWYQGDKIRRHFWIYAAPDGATHYKGIFSGVSSGKTAALEKYTFKPVRARYVAVAVLNFYTNIPAGITEINIGHMVTDGIAPTLTITAPAANAQFYPGAATIKGTAVDNVGGSGVKSVEVSIDSGNYSAAKPKASGDWSTWSLPLTLSLGKHTINARAYDVAGNVSVKNIPINVIKDPDPILGYDNAKLLLIRTSFAASQAQVVEFAKLRRSQAVDRILSGVRTVPTSPVPEWAKLAIPDVNKMPPEEKKIYLDNRAKHTKELPQWWYREMIVTTSPFTEKMTLFWHNHFANGLDKVYYPELMYKQIALFRGKALGNFRDMLHAIGKDPAMLIYLDGISNYKAHPNENFAREVMELFTLGEGNYTQSDVTEAARAFTGWTIDSITKEFKFVPSRHDTGSKTILGKTGNFDGDAVLDILLEQPATAEFITAKLWKEFISYNPNANEVKRLAAIFRANYDIKALMRALLSSDHFYATQNRAILFKSPTDLIVGIARQLDLQFEDTDLPRLQAAGKQMGQLLMYPPNVKGWPAGDIWINSATLMARYQFIGQLFSQIKSTLHKMPDGHYMAGKDMPGHDHEMHEKVLFDIEKWFSQFPADKQQRNIAIERLMLSMTPVEDPKLQTDEFEVLRQMVLDQVYQLQ